MNCQTCKHFRKTDEYVGGHYIGQCQNPRGSLVNLLGKKVDGLSSCEDQLPDILKIRELRERFPDKCRKYRFIADL